jgi:hypothetical protein
MVIAYVYELSIKMFLLLPTSNGYDLNLKKFCGWFFPMFFELSNLLKFLTSSIPKSTSLYQQRPHGQFEIQLTNFFLHEGGTHIYLWEKVPLYEIYIVLDVATTSIHLSIFNIQKISLGCFIFSNELCQRVLKTLFYFQ